MAQLFFFSSRRRHTRSLRDWSSDVCSSDLGIAASVGNVLDRTAASPGHLECEGVARSTLARSEERRVGKECRSRWSQYDEKKMKNYVVCTVRKLSGRIVR